LHTTVDTSGYAPWPVIDEVRPFVDLFLYDLKLVDEARHIQWTGVTNADILSNLGKLSAAGSRIQVRVPLIPGINDDKENLRALGTFLAVLPNVPPVELLPYHNIAEAKYAGLGRKYALPEIHSPTPERVEEIRLLLRGYELKLFE
jgi:pyruvate formate lyase activating enzyme